MIFRTTHICLISEVKGILSSLPVDHPVIQRLLILVILLLGVSVLHWIIFKTMGRVDTRREIIRLKEARRYFKRPSYVFLLVLAIRFYFLWEDQEAVWVDPSIHVITLALIGTIAWMLINGTRWLRSLLSGQYDLEQRDNLRARKVHTQLRILERIVVFIIILVALGVALMTFDSIRRIGISLFASAGVAGIILGFAAQRVIANLLAGFQIAVTQPIRIDDVVIVEDEWGWIEEINLTYVVVRIWDKRRLILPTTYFIEKPFQNWTRVSADILGTVYVYTDYGFPVDQLRDELDHILEDNPHWDGRTKVVQVTNATESTMEVRVLVSATDSPTAWDLRVYLREKLIDFVRREYPEYLPKTRVELPGK